MDYRFSTIGLKAVLGGLRNDATEIGAIKNLICRNGAALIAYSGGVDSTWLPRLLTTSWAIAQWQ